MALGLGHFTYFDLDTPHLLAEDPIVGGPTLIGPQWDFTDSHLGHGMLFRDLPPVD